MKFSHPILFSVFIVIFTIGLSPHLYSSENTRITALLEKLSRAKDDTSRVNTLLKLAEETGWSDFKSSEIYAKQALNLSQQINYKKGMAYALNKLANLFSDYEFDYSEKLAIRSLELAKQIDDSILMVSVYNVFGNLKYNLNQNEDAMMYYNKALDICLRLKQDSSAAAIYSNLGSLSAVMHDDSTSINYFLKAAKINKENKNYLWLAVNYMNLGDNYINYINLNQEGIKYLEKSLLIVDEHNFNRLYPWLYNNFSRYFLKLKDYEKSISYANKALIASKENENKLEELEALLNLNEAHVEISEIEIAYSYLKQIDIVKDSINKHNRLKELDLLELKYKFEEEQRAQELETAVLQAGYYRKELFYLFILSVSVLVIFAFLFLYITQRNRAHRKSLEQKTTLLEKDKLSRDLEYKNKELATNVMYSIEKNKVLTSITEELFEIQSAAVLDETREAIHKISGRINQFVDAKAWEEFEIRFQQVHTGFYASLSKKYPDLTPNEKRLCAFLRLDMSSKEISKITGQSVPALQVGRTRLRKKLGISKTEINLVAFLSQF